MIQAPRFFDIHSHLESADYDDDREEVISRMRENNTWTICVGTTLETSQKTVELAERYEGIFSCIGIHPVDKKGELFREKEFETLVSHPKVVAIGECGLDYFRTDEGDNVEKIRQKNLFEEQINFSIKHKKPLMIHSRNAYEDTLDILESYAKTNGDKLKGNVHFFAGDLKVARRFISIGFTLSFTGVLTFARDYDEVVGFTPKDMILSETDAPYVAPIPFRGKRNEPSYVEEVAKKIAEIRNEEVESFKIQLVKNARKSFAV